MRLPVGKIINNRYRIVKLLGQGGFGAVYRVWDMNMDCPRALKENLDTSPEAQKQFKLEAKLLGDLIHPNLPRVIDHFIIPGQGQYLVMDYVEGEDLREMLDKKGGPLPESKVLPWIEQVCDALGYLHSQKPPIIHRDIKPANIRITPEGKAMLVDFGIAKVFDPLLSTTIGARAVTPGYSPHEQYGQGKTDSRTDVYALGATLYSLLTGDVPVESINRVIKDPLLPPEQINPAISPNVASAISQAMKPDSDQRPPSTKHFKDAIKAQSKIVTTLPLSQPVSTQTTPFQTGQTQGTSSQLKPFNLSNMKKWLPGAAGLIGVVILVAVFWPDNPTPTATPTATVPVVVLEPTNTWMPTASLTETIIPSPTPFPTPIPPSPTPLPSTPTDDPSIPPPCTEVGQTWTSPVDGMVLSCIPAGEFEMGSEDGNDDEKPVHTVYLDAYWMDQTEVTNAMFALFLTDLGNQSEGGATWLDVNRYANIKQSGSNWSPESGFEEHPVVEVTWYGARAYCTWAGRRLPTEAEWEKATRGEIGFIYSWGNDFECNKGNSDDETSFDSYVVLGGVGCDGFIQTAPVGSFPGGASPYGLLDMTGNIWEWVLDWYGSGYYHNSPIGNPQGPSSGDSRVIRGGSWSNNTSDLRSTYRGWVNPRLTINDIGFRCARSP